MVTRQLLRPAPGETSLIEHELVNPLGRDSVFSVVIHLQAQLQQLTPIESVEEYRNLKAALGGATIVTSSSRDKGGSGGKHRQPGVTPSHAAATPMLEGGKILAGGRVFLAAKEKLTLPFKFQLTQQRATAISSESSSSQVASHSVTVEFTPVDQDYPVSVLELQV